MSFISIKKQGTPKVASATLVLGTTDVVIIELDMDTKYCTVQGLGGFDAYIVCTENTRLEADEDRNDATILELDNKNYELTAVTEGRYNITLVFTRYGFMYEDFERKPCVWFDYPGNPRESVQTING